MTIRTLVTPMPKPKPDTFDDDILAAYDSGQLRSVATKSELAVQGRARATAIRTAASTSAFRPETQDIQVRALEEGVPYQTLIASVLHK